MSTVDAVTTSYKAGVLAATLRVDVAGAQARVWLEQAGVPCIVLKGRSLAVRLYDSVWERPYSDTDLLVPAAQHPVAARVLCQHGYHRIDRDGDRLGAAGYAHTFTRPDGALVDLHWNLSGATADPSSVWATMREHTTELPVGGAAARVPDDEAIALIVALHHAHHGGRTALAAADLERAIAAIELPAWRGAQRLAQQLGAIDAFTSGLRLSEAGTRLAGRLGMTSVPTLEYRLREGDIAYPTWALHRLSASPGRAPQIGVLREIVFPPPQTMRQFFPLARRGSAGLALAYLTRPVRLARRAPAAVRGYRRARRSVAGSRRRVS